MNSSTSVSETSENVFFLFLRHQLFLLELHLLQYFFEAVRYQTLNRKYLRYPKEDQKSIKKETLTLKLLVISSQNIWCELNSSRSYFLGNIKNLSLQLQAYAITKILI